MNDDQELLCAFAEQESQEAFATLVQRHLPMIYAAAFRQTRDAHRAEEISLTAFTLLARKAGSLKTHPAVGGWLYTTTAHLAARMRRTEGRRLRREQEAHAMNEANAPTGDVSDETLRPIVDEVVLDLSERDRIAVLLRFFESQSYGAIGQQLGLTENAARMRVDRALEHLRTLLQRRGIASTAAALGAALSAQATLLPPAGLGAGIATSASAAVASSGLFFFMNTSLLKTGLAVAAVGLGAGGLLWQHHENTRLQAEVAMLQSHLRARPASASRRAQASSDAPPNGDELARLSAQVAALQSDPAASWQERAEVLRELMEQFPEFQIPELALATPEDWLDATKNAPKTDADYRRALAQVRTAVLMRFSNHASAALKSYMKQNNGAFPSDPAQLEQHVANPLGPEVWQHYKISPASRFPSMKLGGDSVLTVKSPVDADYDSQIVVGPLGTGTMLVRGLVIQPVAEAYRVANPGKQPASLADLMPYAKTNAQRSAIQADMAKD